LPVGIYFKEKNKMRKSELTNELRLYLQEQSQADHFSGSVLVAKDGQQFFIVLVD